MVGSAPQGSGVPLLEMRNISKGFPGVQALDHVSIDVMPGEVHGLVGENGAGKSTLMKILSGVYAKDSGEIVFRGCSLDVINPKIAQALGIVTIYQELNLVPNMTVAANIFLGRECRKGGILGVCDDKRMFSEAQELLNSLGVEISAKTLVSDLGVAQQQMVEIAKAVSSEVKLLVMDEPTSTLTSREIGTLFALVRRLKGEGMSIIFISHRLEEVLAITDRVTVLRDGRNVGTLETRDATKDTLVKMMVGREIQELYPSVGKERGAAVLEVRNLRGGRVKQVSLSLHAGEVLGVAGLVGAGRTEAARMIFGVDQREAGDIYVDGRKVRMSSPLEAIRLGLGFVPEDRKEQGLILDMAVAHNITLAGLRDFSQRGVINNAKESVRASQLVETLQIRTPSLDKKVRDLSGGNQQKVILARWLLLKPRVLILDEPTRGIDVGAKVEIYHLIRNLAAQGVGIILISSELPELLGLSDRVIVMAEGRVTGEFTGTEATQEALMASAAGLEPAAV